MKDHSELKDSNVFGVMYLGGVIVAASASLFAFDWNDIGLSSSQMYALFYLGVIPSGLCFFLWNVGGRRVNVGTMAVLNNLKVPLATICSLVIFKEAKEASVPFLAVGTALIILATVLSVMDRQKVPK